MAVESLSERPIFAAEEHEYLQPVRPPLSRMALLSVIVGIISFVVIFNSDILFLSVIAVALGIIAYFNIQRTQASSGSGLALTGIALGLIFGTWSYTASRLRDQYFFNAAGEIARHYLEVVAEGDYYKICELTRPETERQVAGTPLPEYYAKADEFVKERLDNIRKDTNVLKSRAWVKIKWQLQNGVINALK